jgi:hypothetical protein
LYLPMIEIDDNHLRRNRCVLYSLLLYILTNYLLDKAPSIML